MHVLYLTSFYPVSERVHHGIFFRDHAEALAQKHHVSVLNIQVPSLKSGKTFKTEIRQLKKNNVNTVHAVHPVLSHRFKYFVEKAQFKALFRGLNVILQHRNIDVIIAQCSMPAGWWARQVKDKTGIPFGVIEHFSFLKEDIQNHPKKVREIYKESEFVGFVSEAIQSQVENDVLDSVNTAILPNVISQDFKFKEINERAGFKWLAVLYDEPKKGPDILTESWKRYQENHPQDEITIVGSGKFTGLREMDRVHIIESAERDEMVKLMSQHHALISTSRQETFGMAVAEMLALGRPVVVTPSGGPEQFVTKKNGLITPSFESVQVVESMTKLRNMYSSYKGRQIREDILKKFGAEAYISRIDSLLSHHV